MAYFHRNETEETLQQPAIRSAEERVDSLQDEYMESDYDDGFDAPDEQEETELSKEERNEISKKRFRMLSGAGNLAAVIAGTLLILILLSATTVNSIYEKEPSDTRLSAAPFHAPGDSQTP